MLILQQNESKGMTKLSYMKAVINGIQAVDTVDVAFVTSGANNLPLSETTPVNCISNCNKRKKIYVRLLLSIDRRETTASAMETVLSEDYICIFFYQSNHSI